MTIPRPGSRLIVLGILVLLVAVSPAIISAAPEIARNDNESIAQVGQDDLADTLDGILDDPRLDGAQAGVLVRDAESGETWYERDADERLLPASNQKLFTSTAAFDVLGPDYQFRTSVLAEGNQTGPVFHGDVYLRGGGDPTMLAEDYDELAAAVSDSGIQRIRGDLIADDSFFDDVRLGPEWAWSDEPYYYGAQISALTISPNEDYDAGTVIVEVAPGDEAGDPAEVEVTPDNDYITIDNQATTEAGGARSISIDRPHGENRIVVSGSIGAENSGTRVWRSVWEPTGLAADVFANALEDHGVEIHGDITFGQTPDTAEEIAAVESMTLAELHVPFMKLSNNGHAEVLIKTMGREVAGEGSWDAGTDVAQDYHASLGVDVDRMRMADGSGLSRFDLVAPREISDLLIAVQDEEWFETWNETLPIAGINERLVGGTLRSRMAGTAAEGNVHAKTGTLTSATALSGYVTTAGGDDLVFSIMFNNHLGGSPKDLEDDIAIALAEYSAQE